MKQVFDCTYYFNETEIQNDYSTKSRDLDYNKTVTRLPHKDGLTSMKWFYDQSCILFPETEQLKREVEYCSIFRQKRIYSKIYRSKNNLPYLYKKGWKTPVYVKL